MRKFNWWMLIFIAYFLIIRITFAQESRNDIANTLSTMMNNIRNEKPVTNSKKMLAEDPNIVLELLTTYEKDGSPRVRERAYALIWQIAKPHPNPKVRQEATSRLLNGLKDPEPLVWQQSSKYLSDFNSEDFSENTRVDIRQFLNEKEPRREIIRIVGIANMQEEMEMLEKLLIDEPKYETGLQSGRWYGTVGWAARLARARMGSKVDISRAIELVEAEPDDIVRVTVLLKDIAYIRQPEAIKLLHKYLESDKRLPSVKPSIPGTGYSQYALDLLAQLIKDFPVKSVGPGGYSQSEIDLARKWMSTQKEFKTLR